MGWAYVGSDLHTTFDGGVGIGTSTPAAKLDVRGTLNVEEDLSLMPGNHCLPVTFDNPTGDLGDRLVPYLDRYSCIDVTLKASTNWTWNRPVVIRSFQTLRITGEGYQNGATNLTVTILMTVNQTSSGPADSRAPGRVAITGQGGSFLLQGVNLIESAKDSRTLTSSCTSGALFVAEAVYSTIELSQIRIQSTEDIVSVSSRAFVNIKLGHTWIDKNTGSTRDILAVKSYTGWCFGGGFGFVHRSHTTLGTGVTFDTNPKIQYSN